MTVTADGVSAKLVQPTIYRGVVTPISADIGDLWEDTSSNPPVLKHCTAIPNTFSPVATGGGGGSGTVTNVTGTAPVNVANGTTAPVVSLNTSGANSVVVRDANQNIAVNAVDEGYTNTAASGTQITLTAASPRKYTITGTGGQVIKLPDATTLPNGAVFQFDNNQTSGTITVNNNSNTLIVSVPSGGYVLVNLLSNAIAAGSWDRHDQAPSSVSWSTNTFDYAGSITSATWNGVAVALNRGGTGANTSAAALTNLLGYTTTATAAGTTTLDNTSSFYQLFTGSTTQTVVLPVTSTLALGWSFRINNSSSGALTVQSSGLNAVVTVNGNTTVYLTCINTGVTDATGWRVGFTEVAAVTGSGSMVLSSGAFLASPTITGTLNFNGTNTSASNFHTTQTSGLLTIGGAAGTGLITIGRSTATQTTSIQDGVTTTGNTKTITMGTGGASGSTTNITLGSATSGATSITTINGALNYALNTVTVTSGAGTIPVGYKVNNFTNSGAVTMAITMATTGAVNGQMTMVRIYDFSAAAQTIGWTNTEDSTVTAPTLSNGSTTLPLTVGFMYNGATSRWRCIAKA